MPTFASAVGDDVKLCVWVCGGGLSNKRMVFLTVRPVQREGKDR